MQSDLVQNGSEYDIEKEIKAFDESKAGVKGLVDSGIVKLPPFFLVPEDKLSGGPSPSHLQIPVIDLKDIHDDPVRREKVIEEIKSASETWGFFQVVNHGVPKDIMEGMIEGVKGFHEEKDEVKKKYYSRDTRKKVTYTSNTLILKTKAADWKDTLYFRLAPESPDPEELPVVCRDTVFKYSEHIKGLGGTLFKLVSQALGLKPDHLIEFGCAKGSRLMCHYYPACPEPNRTLGSKPHTDPDYLTILMQDHIGGLQVFHQNQWINVHPIPGAFVINVGDLLELLSNGKFKSAEHRVLANHIGPRISVAAFFAIYDRICGPLKELLSEENPPLYKDVPLMDYITQYMWKEQDGGMSTLDRFRL